MKFTPIVDLAKIGTREPDALDMVLAACGPDPYLEAVMASALAEAAARFAPKPGQAERDVAALRKANRAPRIEAFDQMADEPLTAEQIAWADYILRREMEASDDRLDYPAVSADCEFSMETARSRQGKRLPAICSRRIKPWTPLFSELERAARSAIEEKALEH
jgi:hypothetical protein